jgi:predicted transposase YbfD/YdcC
MFAKGNQPGLLADIQALFERAAQEAQVPSPRDCLAKQRVKAKGDKAPGLIHRSTSTTELGHGRIESRSIQLLGIPVWADWFDWPGALQIFRVHRSTKFKKNGNTRSETIFGITSLAPHLGTPERLLHLCRGHWTIENRSHWVRDVTFDEDRSTVRTGSIPQVMAALRNTAIGLIRLTGKRNVAAATRTFAAQNKLIPPLILNIPTFE